MLIVYRVEHKEQRDYRSNHYMGAYQKWPGPDIREVMNRMPAPCPSWFKGYDGPHADWVFGCICREFLDAYLGGRVLECLTRLGYVLRLYAVPLDAVTHDSDMMQCAFDVKHARIVREFYTLDEYESAKLYPDRMAA